MVLAICGLGGSNAGKEAVNNNVLASNFFSFYQAKNARQIALELAADEIELGWLNDPALPDAAKQAMRAKLAAYKTTIARYESEPATNEGKKELMARARDHEKKRDHALKQDPYFDYAEALLQIAIVLISVVDHLQRGPGWLFSAARSARSACCSPSMGSTCWWKFHGWHDAEALRPRRTPGMLELRVLYFEDLHIRFSETLAKTVAASDVVGFAQVTGDRNPRYHLSEHFAARTQFKKRIAHGLYTASLISAVLGTRLPGPGAIYISQTLNFHAPVKIGDTVEVTVTVAELIPDKRRARLACVCKVAGEVVLDGEALVKVPARPEAGRPELRV